MLLKKRETHTFRRSDVAFHLPELWGGSRPRPISQHALLIISCLVYSVFSLRSSAVLWVQITLKNPTGGDVSKGNIFVFFFKHARVNLLHADLHNPTLAMFNVACDHLSSFARDFFSWIGIFYHFIPKWKPSIRITEAVFNVPLWLHGYLIDMFLFLWTITLWAVSDRRFAILCKLIFGLLSEFFTFCNSQRTEACCLQTLTLPSTVSPHPTWV